MRHQQQRKVYIFEQKNRGRKISPPKQLSQLVKLSLDGLLPSRAHLRFTLQVKSKLSY
jgi:hypothetical protein